MRLKATSAGSGRVVVAAPSVRTGVVAGTGPRVVGALVSDRIDAEGLIPRAVYTVTATLQDAGGLRCATTAVTAQAGFDGTLQADTPAVAVCGGRTDTFVETVRDSHRRTVASTPPGQPTETFPVTPVVITAVRSGNGIRTAGTPVIDRITAIGLLPSTGYLVTASLTAGLASSAGSGFTGDGIVCGTVSAPVITDKHGAFTMDSAPVGACGPGRDTFTERVTTTSGVVVASTPPGQPTETFPVTVPPVAVVSHPPVPTSPVTSAPVTRAPVTTAPSSSARPTPTPAHSSPAGVPPAASAPSVTPVGRARMTPPPQLALTGATPMVLLLAGLLGVAGGACVLLLSRRRPRC